MFSLLRPFVLGICILFFNTLVLGTINGIFDPIIDGTSAMLKDEKFNIREYQKSRDKLKSAAELQNILKGGIFVDNKIMDDEIGSFGWNDEDYASLQDMYATLSNLSVEGLIQMAIREVVQFLFQAASLVVDTIRTFFLVVLSILGPLAFALSVFDGFQNTLVQ